MHQKQVEIAKNYGIYGFCYYFYWFKGKRLLEQPLDLVINNPDLDFPFCLFWANESWARNWDGSEKDILIKQEYSEEDDLNLIKFLVPIFKDKRYIRVDNKPLINIYRPNLMPDMKKTINTWKEYCKTQGIDDLYITISNTHSIENPSKYGADAAIEYAIGFPNQFDIKKLELFNYNYTSGAWIYNYEDVIRYSLTKEKPNYTEFRSLCPDWDNEARRNGGKGGTLVNSTPSLYKLWLENLIKNTRENLDEGKRIIFINAWNEWAEGAYLEPDFGYGYSYLDATARALIDSDAISNKDDMNNLNYDCPISIYKDYNVDKIKFISRINKNDFIIRLLSENIKKSVLVFDHNEGGGAFIYLRKKILFDINNDNTLAYIVISQFDVFVIDIYTKNERYTYYCENLEEISFIYNLLNVNQLFLNSLVLFRDLYKIIDYIIYTAKTYNIDIVYPFHDYFPICSSHNLIFTTNYKNVEFCNIPMNDEINSKCSKCILNNYDIVEYRNKFQKLFDVSKEVLLFSNSSLEYVKKVFTIEEEKVKIIPHKVDWINYIPKKSKKKNRFRVGIIGFIAENKGFDIFTELLELSLRHNYDIDFYCIGMPYIDLNYDNLFITGSYKNEDLPKIVEKLDIDIFIMISIWPETFSYVTEEIILMNKPIISFNLGAQGEKVSKYANGYIANEVSANSVLDILVDFYRNYN